MFGWSGCVVVEELVVLVCSELELSAFTDDADDVLEAGSCPELLFWYSLLLGALELSSHALKLTAKVIRNKENRVFLNIRRIRKGFLSLKKIDFFLNFAR